ncbi:MAG: hypothetical protein KAH32_03750, partial [Chlamydiia bacterium]|nr:hypothetical protein [Chlamydiia bacterium]
MKKTLFILAALSCSFGGLGDLTRKAISKEYQSFYSDRKNLKDFLIGGPISSIIICTSIYQLIVNPKHQSRWGGCIGIGCAIIASTNCFGSTPANALPV